MTGIIAALTGDLSRFGNHRHPVILKDQNLPSHKV